MTREELIEKMANTSLKEFMEKNPMTGLFPYQRDLIDFLTRRPERKLALYRGAEVALYETQKEPRSQ